MTIDFTEERRRIEFVEDTARTDVLTGLLNRPGLLIEFASLQSADGFEIFTLDLDGFKQVNMPMDLPWETTFCRPRGGCSMNLKRMRDPIPVADEIAAVHTSIGGFLTAAKRDMPGLMKEADVLLCEAKAAGKDAVRF